MVVLSNSGSGEKSVKVFYQSKGLLNKPNLNNYLF